MAFVTAEANMRMAGMDDNFITKNCNATGVPNLRTDDWLSYYADIVAGAVQYGNRTDLCNYLEPVKNSTNDTVIAQRIVDFGNENGNSPTDYDRTVIANTTVDPQSAGRPWTYQYCTEYGWFQSMSVEHPMRSPVINAEYFS